MAVRVPLYYNSGNLQEMSSAMVDQIVDQTVYQYSLNPSVTLTVHPTGVSGGPISPFSAITDTRLQAGAMVTDASSFPSEATTAEPSVVTINYDRISETRTTLTPTADTGLLWPVYYDSSTIRAMSLQDVKDTFLHPAIDLLTSGSTGTQQGGTYHINSSTSVTGSTEVSGSNVFVYSNTQADTTAYSASGIAETLDQPTTITSFYLHKVTGSNTAYTSPVLIDGSSNLQEYPDNTFKSMLQEWIRHTAVSSSDGYKLSYNVGASGSGNTRGSGMADTRLNGTGDYQTYQAGADDYRAQEFPNGTATTIATYYLRINKS